MTSARFVGAYLARTDAAADFYPSHFAAPAHRAAAVARAAARPLEGARLAAIRAQNARWPAPAREANLARLADGAACVVTGQQVGLFLGPLYTVYKAASAVRTAAALEAETGTPVVPVFWLQTEDHDFAEAAQVQLPGADGAPVLVEIPEAQGQRRASLAHRQLGPDVVEALDALAGHLEGPHAAPHLDALRAAYRPEATWPEAFARVLADLFADEGLIIVDPRDRALGAAAAPVHARALSVAEPLAGQLEARRRALEEAGFRAPVTVRPGAPLSFFHAEGPAGPRYRLAPARGGYRLVGGPDAARLEREALLDVAAAEPLAFSTSALLRPILQDSLLPTAAYVGGPGEIDYFAQLPPVYAAFDLSPPLLVPRHRFRVVTPDVRRDLDRLGLAPEALERPELELLAQVGLHDPSWPEPSAVQDDLLQPLGAALEALGPRLAALEPGLGDNAERTAETASRAVGKLVDKYRRALLRQQVGHAAPLRRARRALRPGGHPQERVHGLSAYAARYGARAFVARVLEAAAPFDPEERTLEP